MTPNRASFFGLATLLGVFGGCAGPPGAGGDAAPVVAGRAGAAPAVQHPGPGWMLLGSSEEGALFLHPLSTLRVGSSAFIMVVANKREPVLLPGGVRVGSIRQRIEIDCDKRRFRRHDGTAHPDGVALGPVLGKVGQEQWREVPPNTVMAAVSLAVCSATAPDGAPPPGNAAPGIEGAPPEPAMPRFPRNRRNIFTT